jgi:predicted ferric reductase
MDLRSETASLAVSPRLEAAVLEKPGWRRTRAREPKPLAVDVAVGLLGVGLGVTIALAVTAESWGALRASGGWSTAGGRLAGLVGAYLMLVVVLLAGRVPAIERSVGQDRLVRWHRSLAPWSLVLIAAHGALITVGYAEAARTGVLHQFGALIGTYPGILAATVAFILLIVAGFTSARIARRRMRYETWWAVHLYIYLALALSFSHQVATGASFVGHPVVRLWWTVLWLMTAGVVLAYRVLLPVWRTVLHRLRVVSVQEIAPGVVTVVCRGRWLERLPFSGGQFFQWRILKRGLWWQAHPYSVSAAPAPPYLRFTVKDLGDHSQALAALTPGTRLAIEGPYGTFTSDVRSSDRVALIGAGVGVTPLRALLQDLPGRVDIVMINRAHSVEELVHRDELRRIIDRRSGQLHELVGSRTQVSLDAQTLSRLVPDLATRDLYICGPAGFTATVRQAARALGVAPGRIHAESFAF